MEAWFANPWLLLFAGAALIPWLIRFLLRPRYRVVPWAATRLMTMAHSRVQARSSWLQWLVLVVQTLALLLLAVALASPVGGPQGLLSAVEPPHRTWWILVVDDSYSMQYVDEGESHFKQALRQASELVDDTTNHDAFSLLSLAAAQPWVIGTPSYDHAAVQRELTAWQPTPHQGNLLRSLAAIDNQIEAMDRAGEIYEQIRVVFWSDLSSTTWDDATGGEAQAHLESLQDKASSRLIDLGAFGKQNLVIPRLKGVPTLAPSDVPFSIWAEVVNEDPESMVASQIRLSVDGEFQAEFPVRLEPLEKNEIKLPVRVSGAGPHWLQVESSLDPLDIDHRRWAIVEVPQQLTAICWTDQAAEALYLTNAIRAINRGGLDLKVEMGEPRSLVGKRPRQTLLVIGSVSSINDEQCSQLRMFLEQGGAVLVFAGPLAQPWKSLGCLDEPWSDEFAWKTTETSPADLRLVDPTATLTRVFQGDAQETLLQTPVWRQWVLPDSRTARFQSLIESESGGTLLGTATLGKGRCVFWLSAIDPDPAGTGNEPAWSALALWPSYPALLSRMVDWAIGGESEATLTLPLLADQDNPVLDLGQWKRASVDSERPAADRDLLPGIYRREIGLGQISLRAVNVDCSESASDRITPGQLPEWFYSAEQTPSSQHPSQTPSDQSRWYQWALLAVLGLLLVEVGLVGRINGGRSPFTRTRSREQS